jgi:F-type H+-transporting ATPase subunit delta
LAADASGLSGIAERYATALYELADEAKTLDEVAADLADLKAMIQGSEGLRRAIRSPLLDRDEVAEALTAILEKAGASDLTRKFVGVVASHRRAFALPAMIDAYLEELARRRGEITARVTSAAKLTKKQTDDLEAALKKALGSKVKLDAQVDPNIIGGLVVRVGSRMFDTSIRTKLQRMQLAMKGVG